MSYNVRVYSQPRDFLKKLDTQTAQRIKKKLEAVQQDPYHYLEHFSGADVYKLRIGDYRALIDVEDNTLNVQVLDHRKRIQQADIAENEQVLVVNNTNGNRLWTYVIPGKENSGTICMNGAAAHRIKIGDEIIIMAFETTNTAPNPRNILVDENNKLERYL